MTSRCHFCVFFLLFLCSSLRAQWQVVGPALPKTPAIPCVCSRDGIFWVGSRDTLEITPDSGKTWQFVRLPLDRIRYISFFDPLHGALSLQFGGIYTTSDGGLTWSNVLPYTGKIFQAVVFNGSPQVIHALTSQSGILYTSTDGGASWSQSPSFGDYGFGLAVGGDRVVSLFASNLSTTRGAVHWSSDLGQTWQQGSDNDGDSWSLAADSCDGGTLYLVSENIVWTDNNRANIYKTTDRGITWTPIDSHPGNYFSGALATTKRTLIAPTLKRDGILGMEHSTDASRTWKSIGGPPLQFDAYAVACSGSNTILAVDSAGHIWITTNSGGYPVPETIDHSSGLRTADQKMDTIGTTAHVPLSIDGLPNPEDVELVMHYDTLLQYTGSFDANHTRLDKPGEQWKGRTKLFIPQAASGDTISTSDFVVYSDSLRPLHVTFDSLVEVGIASLCAFSSSATATSTINPVQSCGAQILSRLIHHGEPPRFTIQPNPTVGAIEIQTSQHIGATEVTIYDILGHEVGRSLLTLTQNEPQYFTLPVKSGVYYLRLQWSNGRAVMRVLVSK